MVALVVFPLAGIVATLIAGLVAAMLVVERIPQNYVVVWQIALLALWGAALALAAWLGIKVKTTIAKRPPSMPQPPSFQSHGFEPPSAWLRNNNP